MKDKFRVNHVLIFGLLLPLLWACRKEEVSPQPPLSDDGKVRLAIHVEPVNTRAAGNQDYFDSEKIKSLRIILIGTDTKTNLDTIEFNEYISVKQGGMPASEFQYDYIWRTKPGSKKFYILANEESAATYTSSSDSGSAQNPQTISELLNSFSKGEPADNIDETLNSIVFTPNFVNAGNDVFLPYSSVYEGIIVGEKDFQEIKMFVVPAATKFMFNFTNNLPFAVNISEINVSFTNTKSYLLGQVNESDLKKEIDGSELYWVDWLAEISQMSQENTGYYPNTSFNELYGWISDYDTPTEDLQTSVLVGEENSFTLSASEIDNTGVSVPGTRSTGPYYLPESKNLDTSGSNNSNDTSNPVNSQIYYLDIVCEAAGSSDDPQEFNTAIANLKSLFRNTYVIINIAFSQGDVEVYAEIADWNRRSIQGWVTEGQPTPGLTSP